MKNHEYWLSKCLEKAEESNCKLAQFGCYIVKNGKALGSGCNHVIREGFCCLKPKDYRIGNNPGLCWAVHAEWEALIKALRDHGEEVAGSILYIAGMTNGKIRKHLHFSCTVCVRLLYEAEIACVVRIAPSGPIELSMDYAVDLAYEELIKKGGGEKLT